MEAATNILDFLRDSIKEDFSNMGKELLSVTMIGATQDIMNIVGNHYL